MKTRQKLGQQPSEKAFQSGNEVSAPTMMQAFFDGISRDPRISCGHIGMYAALLHCWTIQGYSSPLLVFSHQVISLAKVSSRDTYFRYVRQLSEYGYIRYEPSFSSKHPSAIYFDLPDSLMKSKTGNKQIDRLVS